ncbi:hypothetical protein Tco_0978997 [Tanacetum coccineum]|uniref:Uncharacterized protein n=1 Tax=Tanacetum coccineum TaxID=301880 RepID=A0ABQ5EPH9_9ASTR
MIRMMVKKYVTYFDLFLPSTYYRKAYNTIMVEGLESTGKNLVVDVRDVYMFVGNFTYIMDFVVLEDIGEFIQINKAEVVMDDLIENNFKPFIAATIIKDRDAFRSEVSDLVSQEFNAQAPKIIEELFKNYVQSNVIQVFSTWMTFGGNTRDLGSFGEETNKITDLHQIHEEVLFIERGDGVAGIKRRRRDLSSDGVRDLAMASGRGRLKEDLESST